MKITSRNVTEPTAAAEQTAIKLLENATVSAPNRSELPNQAENALRVMKIQEYIIKVLGDLSNLKGRLIKAQDDLIEAQDNLITTFVAIIKSQNGTTNRLDDSIMTQLEKALHTVS